MTILIPSLTSLQSSRLTQLQLLFISIMIIKIDTNEVAFDLSFWVKILDLDKLWRSSSYWKSWTWLKSKILSWKTFRYLLSQWRLSKSKKNESTICQFSIINYPTGNYQIYQNPNSKWRFVNDQLSHWRLYAHCLPRPLCSWWPGFVGAGFDNQIS